MTCKKHMLAILAGAVFITIVSGPCHAQEQAQAESKETKSVLSENGLNLDVAVDTVITEAEKAAVGVLIDLFKNPKDVFLTNCSPGKIKSGKCNIGREHGWLFDLAPDVKIKTGSSDTFESIVGKITGNFMLFDLDSPASQGLPITSSSTPIPNLSKPVHVFPISLGVETTRYFDTVSGLAEVGYVPFDLNGGIPNFQLGVDAKLGVFLQGGYKFDAVGKTRSGGAKDESSEKPDSALGRIKTVASYRFELPVPLGAFDTTLTNTPHATGWYNFIDNEFYYSVGISSELELSKSSGGRKTLWDFTVEHGSGEPNFNTGTQFSTGLKITF
ncbi:hypothetical protein [Roseibium sp. Sym1]|uniref:hypothetical protein n=1 Tax=Roseibium sp. Sym1 TaxID=3016006 RepID=UPI0022B2D0C2|nr:hypothetical protein [Roseibium sp. Sym1]